MEFIAGGDTVNIVEMTTKVLECHKQLCKAVARFERVDSNFWVKCCQTASHSSTENYFVKGRANQCDKLHCCLIFKNCSWALVVYTIILATQEVEMKRTATVPGQPSKQFMRPYLENPQHTKRAGRVAQVVEHLHKKHETLSLSPKKRKCCQKKKHETLSLSPQKRKCCQKKKKKKLPQLSQSLDTTT
jgi:hypothetical protein